MIKHLIFTALIFIGFIFGLSYYLQSNDLGKCETKPTNSTDCNGVDAIVAISGGDTDARAKHAIELYKNGWAKVLIFSGAAQDKTGPSNAAVMKKYAVDLGVPESDIRLDEYSENTKQNAENSQTIFTELSVKKVILVTSGYHQRRAGLEFSRRATDIQVINSPVLKDKDWSILWWLTPKGWWLAVGELVKIGVFYFTGLFI
jgi:uncharacterized SAM-binding protein YcdF (DUF218 family)